jgi:hypothetical protein
MKIFLLNLQKKIPFNTMKIEIFHLNLQRKYHFCGRPLLAWTPGFSPYVRSCPLLADPSP